MTRLLRFLVRSTTFLRKELVVVLRQPRMITTLILGPFLIIFLFGASYSNEGRSLRTVFVVKDENPLSKEVKEFAETLGSALIYKGTIEDQDPAMQQLSRNEIDLVVVVPDDAIQTIESNRQVVLPMYQNEIDPFQEDYVRYIGNLYVDALNRRILRSVTAQNQEEAGTLQGNLQAAQESAKAYREALAQRNAVAAATEKDNLNTNLSAIRLLLGTAAVGSEAGVGTTSDNAQAGEALQTLDEISKSLDEVNNDPGTTEADFARKEQKAAEIEDNLARLNSQISKFRSMDPDVVVSPFGSNVENITGADITPTTFFTPAVLILLLQHLFITFAAMSIVQESYAGTMELFKASPISSFEILVGKFLSYFIFGLLLTAALTGLIVFGLNVPMLGDWVNYGIFMAILLFASLSIGFLISLVAENETQAVQYSMLIMLASIFFSGFIIDLRLMWPSMRFFSYLLPATYGIETLHTIMFRGLPAPTHLLGGLSAIAVVLFMIDWLLLRRKLAKR